MGTVPGFRTGQTGSGGTPGQGHDRNKCTLQASPLRERQQGFTRRLIVEALSRVIVETGIHQFSMQQVADEAGVSLRTLYRYFSTREELLAGLAVEVDLTLREAGFPKTLESVSGDGIAVLVGDLWRAMGKRPDLARAWVITNMATGFQSGPRKEHHQLIRRAVESLGPHLTSTEQHRLYAVIRYLAGSLAWKVFTDDFGLETEEAAEAASWALRTLLKEIETGGRPGGRP